MMEGSENGSMKENPVDLQSMIDSINSNINSLDSTRKAIRGNRTGNRISDTHLYLKMAGLENTKAAQLLFDTRIDTVIDGVVNKFVSGDFSDVEKYSDVIAKVFEDVGLGKNSFKGPVSQIFVQNLINTMDSMDFGKAKGNIEKMMLVLRNMKRQASAIDDHAIRRKYRDAIKAFRKILPILAKVYKDRRIFANALHNIVNESAQPSDGDVMEEALEPIR